MDQYEFQSPYGGRGRLDKDQLEYNYLNFDPEFQSPYGGRGRLDRYS